MSTGCRGLAIVRIEGLLVLAAAVLTVGAKGLPHDFEPDGRCTNKFRPPNKVPRTATYYNGLTLNDTCFDNTMSQYDRKKLGNPVFAIGDWGGVNYGQGPIPADHTKALDPAKKRNFNYDVDKNAQQRVAQQFNNRASLRNPDYVINVGDNFYWGGINCECGSAMSQHCGDAQWRWTFEEIYRGKGVDGVQWLGVLGNHDFGGWQFDRGWDQIIAYTWGGQSSTGRWVQPAVYYKSRVRYEDFEIDWFFLDTNLFDVRKSPWWDPEHNICGATHMRDGAGCGEEGPKSIWDCNGWFGSMWAKQMSWLDTQLRKSILDDVEWQAIVTHFPPWWGQDQWKWIISQYGVDLFITGHVHRQDVLHQHRWDNQFKPTVVVVTGGGGGITSEFFPDNGGNDDQYGFMDLTLFKGSIHIEAFSHTGIRRSNHWMRPRIAVWEPKHTTFSPGSQSAGEDADGYGGREEPESDSSFVSDMMNQRTEPDMAPEQHPHRHRRQAAPAAHYDCQAGLSNWQHGWSINKKAWCCDHFNKGCHIASDADAAGEPSSGSGEGLRQRHEGNGNSRARDEAAFRRFEEKGDRYGDRHARDTDGDGHYTEEAAQQLEDVMHKDASGDEGYAAAAGAPLPSEPGYGGGTVV